MQRIALLFACFFICTIAAAQSAEIGGQYPFVHYTPKDGLVNSRIRKAFQDSRGRMYFLTYAGLSVYDGARFRNYTRQNGLRSDLVNDILEITPDSFLVATNNCGLNILVNGQIKDISGSMKECPVVNRFLKDETGTIYIASDDGLFRLAPDRFEKLSTISPSGQAIAYLGDIITHRDFILFTTNDLRNNKGLFLYNKQTNTITDAIPDVSVSALKADPNGFIWVSTQHAILNIDTAALASGKLVLRKPYDFVIDPEEPGSIYFNRQHELLVFSGYKGMTYYNKDGTTLHIPSPEPASGNAQNLFIDREDILWICYDGNGVYKLPNTRLRSMDNLFPENTSGFSSIAVLGADSVWFMMNDVRWIMGGSQSNRMFRITPSIIGIPVIYSHGYLYAVGTHTLYRASLSTINTSSVLSFKTVLSIPDSSSFGGKCVEDPYGRLIFHEKRGLLVTDQMRAVFSYPIDFYDLVEGMHIDTHKRLWVITRREGLQIFSIHPEDSSRYLHREFHFLTEFENASPRCIVTDKNELLWVGTRDDGLMAFSLTADNKLKKIHHYKVHAGLTDNFITSLACDGENNIIIGTQTGLDRLVNLKDGNYRLENITKTNNIFNYVINVWTDLHNNAFALTNAGTILQVNPVQHEEISTEPQLLIEEMKVNGGSWPLPGTMPRLKYHQRNISFNIAAPTFIDEKQVQYSYRLSGSGNNDWSEPGTNADISLLNLSPGKYTLEVKASFPSTSYAPKQIAYSFEILPPWWQTWWFRIPAALLLLLGAVYVMRLYYRRKLEKEKTILEKQQAIEKERTRIATDMHDDLGAGLSRIKFLSETIGIKKQLQQPIEEDISSIRLYSHEMIDKMGEIVWALNEKNDSLSDLLAYTRSYAVEYLSQHGISCTVEAPDQFPSTFVSGEYRRNIYLTVKEALHNIVKHAQASEVMIRIGINGQLRIAIADNGVGFVAAKIRPYSNGLSNMKKRMLDIGGTLEIGHEKGTIITLLSPVP